MPKNLPGHWLQPPQSGCLPSHDHVEAGLKGDRVDDGLVVCRREGGHGAEWHPPPRPLAQLTHQQHLELPALHGVHEHQGVCPYAPDVGAVAQELLAQQGGHAPPHAHPLPRHRQVVRIRGCQRDVFSTPRRDGGCCGELQKTDARRRDAPSQARHHHQLPAALHQLVALQPISEPTLLRIYCSVTTFLLHF